MRARKGKLTRLEAYRLHVGIVEQVASLEQRLGAVLIDRDDTLNPKEIEAVRQSFANFKQFVLMSTDLLAIDLSVAAAKLAVAAEHLASLPRWPIGLVRRGTGMRSGGAEAEQELATFHQGLGALMLASTGPGPGLAGGGHLAGAQTAACGR